MQKKQTLPYCPNAQVHVQPKDGFDACITEHQCFSDDPCPFMQQFTPQTVIKSNRKDASLAQPNPRP